MTVAVLAAAPAAKQTTKHKIAFTSVSGSLAALASKEDLATDLANLLDSFKGVISAAETKLIASTRNNYDAIDKTIYETYLYIQNCPDAKLRARLHKGVNDALTQAGITCKKGSSLPLKLTKLATGGGRDKMSRQSLYALGMLRAYHAGIKAGGLADFLVATGGWAGGKTDLVTSVVNERDNREPDDDSGEAKKLWQARVTAARSALYQRDEGTVAVGVGKLFAADNNDKLVVLIGTFKATGEFVINGALPHDCAAVNTACTAWAQIEAKRNA